jgi:hypothetical protein
METEAARVVWWAILAGGFCGGLARIVLAAQIELPYLAREPASGRLVVFPGVIGDIVLGPIAATLLCGAGASTFDMQTAFDARGFWGPFASSVAAGLASAQMLRAATDATLARIQKALDEELDMVIDEWLQEIAA